MSFISSLLHICLRTSHIFIYYYIFNDYCLLISVEVPEIDFPMQKSPALSSLPSSESSPPFSSSLSPAFHLLEELNSGIIIGLQPPPFWSDSLLTTFTIEGCEHTAANSPSNYTTSRMCSPSCSGALEVLHKQMDSSQHNYTNTLFLMVNPCV